VYSVSHGLDCLSVGEASVRTARIQIGIAVVCTSTGSIFVRLGEWPPLLAALVRVVFGTLLLSAILGFQRSKTGLTPPARRLAAFGGLALAVHLASWIASLSLVSVATGTLLVNTTPIFALVFETALMRHRPRWPEILSVVMGSAGIAVIALGSGEQGGQPLGMALALLGGATTAVYVLCARAAGRGQPTEAALPYVRSVYAHATLFLALAAAITMPQGATAKGLPFILAMAFFSQGVGHTLINLSAKKLPAAVVGIVLLGEPLLATMYAAALFHEVPTTAFWWGAPLVVAGILLCFTPSTTAESNPS